MLERRTNAGREGEGAARIWGRGGSRLGVGWEGGGWAQAWRKEAGGITEVGRYVPHGAPSVVPFMRAT